MKAWPADQFAGQRRRGNPVAGTYEVEIESLNVVPARSGAFKIDAVLRIATPPEYAGLHLYDSFTIGTPADLDAELPETWLAEGAVGARRYHEILTRSGLTPVGDVDKDNEAAVGRRLMTEVTTKEAPLKRRERGPDGTWREVDNPYAMTATGERRIETRPQRYWPVGQKRPGAQGAPVPVSGAERQRICPTCGDPYDGSLADHLAGHA